MQHSHNFHKDKVYFVFNMRKIVYMRSTILIIEDEIKISQIIKSYLEKEEYIVYQAFNGQKALELLKTTTPSLLILDLMLPDIPGEEICKTARKMSNIPIIMLTAKTQEHNILNGLDIGADDYITKPFNNKYLIAKVKAFLRRENKFNNKEIILNNGELVIDLDKHEVKRQGELVLLTPIEYRLLTLFINHQKRVYTREELIELVLPEDFAGYDRVIDSHIKNLRQKIETDSKNPKYIITVFGIGYKSGI